METNKIKINEKEYTIDNNNYTKMLFEVVSGKGWFEFNTNSIRDGLYLFFACLKANNDDFDLSFTDLALVKEEDILNQFLVKFAAQIEKDNVGATIVDTEEETKKK